MTVPRIYLPRPLETGDLCQAAEDQARYLDTVLRMQEGDRFIVFNGGDWEYDAVIRHAAAGKLALEITDKRPVLQDTIEITLCQAIPKAEKIDGIIRHATELGVGRIIPFWAGRSIPRWATLKSGQKRERWQKIALEAARQCGRISVPQIGEIVPFAAMLRAANPEGLNLIFWEEESQRGIREILRDPRHTCATAFFLVIGPEGGFGNDEIDLARGAGLLSVSLGKRVLRVETVALAVLAVLQYERGGLGGAEQGAPHG